MKKTLKNYLGTKTSFYTIEERAGRVAYLSGFFSISNHKKRPSYLNI